MSFIDELKRRNVIRVGFTYAVVGWVIAQVADLALESFGAPEWVMKTLLFFMFVGFIVALFISWAYELTPEGIKKAEDVDPNQSITQKTGRKLDRMAIFVLLLAVGILLAERFLIEDPPVVQTADQTVSSVQAEQVPATTAKAEPSVAVLPFVNMSSDPEQEFFSDGISEEILNVLTRIPNLKVAARTSSFQFKGQNLDIADVGKQLQVNHVLEGSVRKAGETLRITAQLIEVENGFHLWSETFDRKLEDVFAIQDEIAAAIATELRARLTTGNNQASEVINTDAYELYLKGRSLVAQRKEFSLFEGIEVLKAALDIEPDYAPALATLAKAYVVLPWFSLQIPAGEARQQARHWSTRALEIEPDNAEALAVLAIVYFQVDLNPEGALKLLKKAVELNPGSVTANNFLGDIYSRTADFDNALKYELRAAEMDPLGPVQLTDLANVYMFRGEYGKALNLAKRALALDPSFSHAHFHVFDANYFLGNLNDLIAANQLMRSIWSLEENEVTGFDVRIDWARGNQEQAREKVRHMALMAKSGKTDIVDVAHTAASIGDFDTAGELLMQAYNKKDGTWVFPMWVRLPEQAPDSESWQKFWRQPGVSEIADIRRSNGLSPHTLQFGEGRK